MKNRLLLLLLTGLSTLVLSGCPARSHLAPVPDYSNMSDNGDDSSRVTDGGK